MTLSGKKILIISPERWGVNMLSKHHYAIALAKRGNAVYFLNPPSKEGREVELVPTEVNGLIVINYSQSLKGLNRLHRFQNC